MRLNLNLLRCVRPRPRRGKSSPAPANDTASPSAGCGDRAVDSTCYFPPFREPAQPVSRRRLYLGRRRTLQRLLPRHALDGCQDILCTTRRPVPERRLCLTHTSSKRIIAAKRYVRAETWALGRVSTAESSMPQPVATTPGTEGKSPRGEKLVCRTSSQRRRPSSPTSMP